MWLYIMKMKHFFFFLAVNGLVTIANGQDSVGDCNAFLKEDTLVISNSKIERKWFWNGGNIIPVSLKNKVSGNVLLFDDKTPGFNIAGRNFLKSSDLNIKPVAKGLHGTAHLEVSYTGSYEGLDLKRVFTIYPALPTISTDTYLKYSILMPPAAAPETAVNTGVEKPKRRVEPEQSYLDRFALTSKHWVLKFVSFKDQTDDQNNLVSETEVIPFRSRASYTGNLVLANDLASNSSFFILKEAPNTTSQLAYSGADYVVSNRYINVPFSGFSDTDSSGNWIKGYTVTVGVSTNQKTSLFALRQYMKGSVNYDPAKYEMIMMNTWGDRGQDGKIREAFILKELEAAAKLSITHFQIDDGWQQGLSQNSASPSGKLWDAWTAEHWQPNKERFPNGLTKIIQSAKDKNIRLGLWFHPTNENEYKTWKRDADIIINLYKTAGVHYFKIDGVKLPTKEAEINFTKFLEEVKRATDNEVFFNLDLTAHIRGGYFRFRNAGNLFLENRYTDSGVYFPYHTLRNLWMLSHYFPPELLQIEFLNKWRNTDKYAAGDPFAPSKYDFDYLFAITMMAQPLAWMEGSNLPAEAQPVAPLIKKYRSLMADLHNGAIMPVGDQPNGKSWTGFQSVQDGKGYLLVFREGADNSTAELDTYLPANKKVVFENMLSSDKSALMKQLKNGKVEIQLSRQNSFALYRYTQVK